MPSAEKKYTVRVIGDASSVKRSFRDAETAGDRFARRMKRIGGKMTDVGSSMTRYVTLPLAVAGAASVKLAVDFEESMSKIKGLVGASAEQMKLYEATVLKMAGKVGKAPKELAEALYFITSSGFSGAKALDILTMSAKASTAGLGETQVVADALTSALNVYKSTGLSAAEATDIMTAAIREGKMEPEEMADNIGKVIAMAKVMKVSFAEVAASLAAMSLAGIHTDEAAVALNQFFTSLNKPSKQGIAALEKVKLSYADLRDELDKKGVVSVMRTLTDAFKGNVEGLVAVLGNVRSARAVLSMMGLSAKQLDQIFQGVTKSTGDMNAAYEEASDTAAVKLKKALSGLQTVGIEMGNKLIPVVLKVAKKVSELISRFQRLSPETKTFILKLAGIAAVAGPALIVLGKVSSAIGGIAQAAKLAGGAGGGIMIMAGAFIAVVTALVKVQEKLVNVRAELERDPSIPGSAASDMSRYGGAVAQSYQRDLESLVKQIGQGQNIKEARTRITGILEALKALREEAVKIGNKDIPKSIDNMLERFGAFANKFPKSVKSLLKIPKDQLTIGDIDVKIEKAKEKLADAKADLKALGKLKPTPEVKAATEEAQKRIKAAKREIKLLDAMKADVQVSIIDNATSRIDKLRLMLANLVSRAWSIVVKVLTSGSLPAQPRAKGGDEIVTKPTLFLAGEAGPERATFTPLGRGRSAGSGPGLGEVHNHIYLDGREIAYTVLDIATGQQRRVARGRA